MPWLTDPIQSVAKQLSGIGSTISPDVISQVNAATKEALAPPPMQFNAAQPSIGNMGQMQTNASMPPSTFNQPGQFFSGSSFGSVPDPALGYQVPGLAANQGNHPWQINSMSPQQGMTGGGGATSVIGGEWATLDGMNSFIDEAASMTGTPANLIKAMLAREGSFGNDKYVNSTIRPGDEVYAFNGMFRSTAESRGIDFDRMISDDAYAVWAMGDTLRQIKEETGLDWDNVAGYYFAGPNWNNPNWGDETGQNTTWNYKYGPTGVITRWQELDQMGGGGTDWNSIVPNGTVDESWGGFGQESTNGFYGYGTQYGMNGTQHTGADIITPRGSTYFAPTGGTVMCAGTGVGTAADGSACSAFNDIQGGAGRVEVLLDNGAVLIYGHSSAALLQPGQRFEAGAAIGQSGTYNSDHIHLEARVRDASMPSGWRIVNPMSVMGGGTGGGSTGSGPKGWGGYFSDWGSGRLGR